MFDRLKRLRMPLSWHSDEDSVEKIIGAAKRCLDTPDGEILMRHLIQFAELDEPKGAMSHDEALYCNGREDTVKYLIGLINDKP